MMISQEVWEGEDMNWVKKLVHLRSAIECLAEKEVVFRSLLLTGEEGKVPGLFFESMREWEAMTWVEKLARLKSAESAGIVTISEQTFTEWQALSLDQRLARLKRLKSAESAGIVTISEQTFTEWQALSWDQRLARLKSAESPDGADGTDGALVRMFTFLTMCKDMQKKLDKELAEERKSINAVWDANSRGAAASSVCPDVEQLKEHMYNCMRRQEQFLESLNNFFKFTGQKDRYNQLIPRVYGNLKRFSEDWYLWILAKTAAMLYNHCCSSTHEAILSYNMAFDAQTQLKEDLKKRKQREEDCVGRCPYLVGGHVGRNPVI